MTRAGIDPTPVHTKEEGKERYKPGEFDLVIVDITCRENRNALPSQVMESLATEGKTPVVFIGDKCVDTGYAKKVYEAGVADLWMRPLDPVLLLFRTGRVMELFRQNLLLREEIGRFQAENRRLALSKCRLSALAKFAEDELKPVMLVGLDGTILYCNKLAEPLLEFRRKEEGALFDEDLKRKVDLCVASGLSTEFEMTALDKTYGFKMVALAGGEMVYLIGEDLTERMALEKYHRLSKSVFENTIEGISITDSDGIIEMVNPAFTRITGYSKEEAVGKNPSILRSEAHDDEFYRNMWNSLKKKGEWKGEIWNRRKSGEAYPEWLSINAIRDAKGRVRHYIAVFHDISEIKDREEKLKFHADFDALTGLPNRMLFVDRLERSIAYAERNNQMMAILFLDLDNFKKINDSCGHHVGDLFLKEVASRLSAICRREDTVARLGSDEFIFILPRNTDELNAAAAVRRIRSALEKPICIKEHEFYVSISIGVTVFPNDGTTVELLMKNAEMALNRAKREGEGNVLFYTSTMSDLVARRVEIENGLRKAVDKGELRVLYQPKVETGTGMVTGSEALMRWHRSEGEVVSPMEFIPVAEEIGVIFPMGEWILREAARQTRAWHDMGFSHMTIAVNLSAKQFKDEMLVEMIGRVLADSGLKPSFLNLEITENIVMEDVEKAVKIMLSLSGMGIGISIDDFGTGYSSLSYLKKFPLNVLKIDKSFVRDIPDSDDDVAIAMAILSLAKNMNLKVVAEGVETVEQLEFMEKNGCDEIQGYLFSKPVEPSALTELLEKSMKLLPVGT